MPSPTATCDETLTLSPDAEAVRAHLKHLLASAEFTNAPRLGKFLTFVVETSLAGEADYIKESLVAMEVYGRSPDYNPQIDSTVRVEAGRLRSRLKQYYEASGAHESVRIELPRGRYAPIFRITPEPIEPDSTRPAGEPETAPVEVPLQAPRRTRTHNVLVYAGLACATILCIARTGEFASERVDPQTMDLYHRAQDLLRIPVLKNGVPETLPASVVEAVRSFERVTSESPRFAKGWAGLAEAAEWEYELRGNEPPEKLATAKAAALKAIQLDSKLTEAWTVLTSILLYREWDLTEAEKACRRAIELDPRNTLVRQRLIDTLRAQGRTADARNEVEKAIQIQPTAAALHVRKAMLLYEAGNCDEAIPVATAAGDLTNQMPVYPMTFWAEGLCFEQGRQFAEAEKIFRKVLTIQPSDPRSEPALGHLLAISGRHAEAEAVLSEIRRQLARGRMAYVSMALVYTGLGRHEEALANLERAWAKRDDSLLFVAVDPRFRPLHSDPRFRAIAAKITARES